MATVLEDFTVYLTGAGLGLTFGTNLFSGAMPDQPDSIVALFEYPGQAPDYVFGANNPLPMFAKPRVQIVVRDPIYLTGRNTIESVVNKVDLIVNQTINGTYYHRVERVADPALLHRDQKRRVYFALNLAVMRQP